MFDSSKLEILVEDIARTMNLAAVGLARWSDVTDQISALFPGSFSSVQNLDPIQNTLPFIEVSGLDRAFIQSYADHFHQVNPYQAFWAAHKSG